MRTASHLVGQRIKLTYTNDRYTRLRRGDLGTVQFVDDLGTIHVKWDNGSALGLVPGHDAWEIME